MGSTDYVRWPSQIGSTNRWPPPPKSAAIAQNPSHTKTPLFPQILTLHPSLQFSRNKFYKKEMVNNYRDKLIKKTKPKIMKNNCPSLSVSFFKSIPILYNPKFIFSINKCKFDFGRKLNALLFIMCQYIYKTMGLPNTPRSEILGATNYKDIWKISITIT